MSAAKTSKCLFHLCENGKLVDKAVGCDLSAITTAKELQEHALRGFGINLGKVEAVRYHTDNKECEEDRSLKAIPNDQILQRLGGMSVQLHVRYMADDGDEYGDGEIDDDGEDQDGIDTDEKTRAGESSEELTESDEPDGDFKASAPKEPASIEKRSRARKCNSRQKPAGITLSAVERDAEDGTYDAHSSTRPPGDATAADPSDAAVVPRLNATLAAARADEDGVSSQMDRSVELKFEFAYDIVYNVKAWHAVLVPISTTEPLDNLTMIIKPQMQRMLANDGTLAQHLTKTRQHVVFDLELRSVDWPHGPADDLRFLNVSDLFRRSKGVEPKFVAIAKMRLQTIKPSDEQPDDLVQPAAPAPHYDYWRIGNVPVQRLEANSKIKDGKQPPHKHPVDYIWSLVGWQDHKQVLQLSKIPAYDFDDFCIGDCNTDSVWYQQNPNPSLQYLGPYAGSVSVEGSKKEKLEALHALVTAHEARGNAQVGSGVPFMPPHTLNDFNAEQYGLGVKNWPKDGIHLAVRCFSHLKVGKQPLKFPLDLRETVSKHMDFPAMETMITGRIRVDKNVALSRAHPEITSSLLFQPPLQSTWGMEWWVLPQRPGPQKLYRWREGKLTQFLNDTKVAEGDVRLYAEAHIVPNI